MKVLNFPKSLASLIFPKEIVCDSWFLIIKTKVEDTGLLITQMFITL